MTIDNVDRGPLGDARPHADDDNIKTPGSRPQKRVEDRENVSTVRPEDYPRDDPSLANNGAANRGQRRSEGSGPVSGSGAGAGGKGNAEEYDSDPQGGGGDAPLRTDHGPKTGADAPVGGSR